MTDAAVENKEADAEAAKIRADDQDVIDQMYLTFSVGKEDYGVPISVVTEIVGMQRIMGIPDVPSFIKGVINLRGKVIPVMDVRLRFGMQEREYDERTVVIVLEVGNELIGLIVDRVSEVLEIPDGNIDRTTSINGSEKRSAVSGLGRVDERVAILLDVGTLVSDADVSIPPVEDLA